MKPNRFVSAPFGMLMIAAAALGADARALTAVAVAAVAVVVGLYLRVAATAAVLAAMCAIAMAEPQPWLAALSGLSAAAYLVLTHANMTRPTVFGLIGFAAIGIVATTVSAGLGWLALLAPVAAVVVFAVLLGPFLHAEHTDDTSNAERPV